MTTCDGAHGPKDPCASNRCYLAEPPPVANRLRELRQKAAISQNELAVQASRFCHGASMYGQDISAYERGRKVPRPHGIMALALALDVPSDFLLSRTPRVMKALRKLGILT